MAVNSVQAPAQTQPMSRLEHGYRTLNPGGTLVYDIGKALVQGKSFGEAYDIASGNLNTVASRNKVKFRSAAEAICDATKKTYEEEKGLSMSERLFEGVAGKVYRFFKNLF